MLLAGSNTSECNALAFHEENDFSYLAISRNRIEKLEGLTFSGWKSSTFSKNSSRNLHSKRFIKLKELQILSLAVNNTLEINAEAFYGLENLKHLDCPVTI